MKSKILILKNDRVGDLFTSIKLISSLCIKNHDIKLYLSHLNRNFSFLFKNIKIETINNKTSLKEKFKVFFDILLNKYDKIYILTPKEFYFYLPLIFRKVKFYAIVYNNKKNNRPNNFFRKYLYKYKIVYRNKINEISYTQIQNKLLDNSEILDNNFKNLTIPEINQNFKNIIPNKYIFFQFRYKFFEELKWNISDIENFIKYLNNKYENVLFCSEIEVNERIKHYNNYFEKKFSIIDLNNFSKKQNEKNKNIFFLKNLLSKDMLLIIQNSQICLAKEGMVSHIAYFLNKKCHNLYNFKIINRSDILHQKISYSEWCKGMKHSFSFFSENFDKSIKKLSKQI